MERLDLYPTAIFAVKVKKYGILNQKIEEYIYSLKNLYPNEELKSCVNGWNSPDFNFDDEIPKYICDELKPYILPILKELNWDLENFQMGFANMWSIINNKHAYNLLHTHGDCSMSIAYYVKVPKGINTGGEIYFKDPRSLAMNAPRPATPYKTSTDPNTSALKNPYELFTFSDQFIDITPEEGLLVAFPGWLEHGVFQSTTEEDRIVISANINLYEK